MSKFYINQIYDSGLLCCINTKRERTICSDWVTEYYFSDGGTLPFCTNCVLKQSYIMEDDDDDGTLISKQYYDEVYNLND